MIDYNRKLSNERETHVPSQKNVYPCTASKKILSVSFMLFYEHYLTTTGPDSKLNSTAIDISILYALMDFSFWFETINLGRSIVYINGSQVIISSPEPKAPR